jgi:hypothetical protein
MKIISEFELSGKLYQIQKQDSGTYDVFVDGENKQPNHDAEGIIRYLSHVAQNFDYLLQKKNNS